MPGVVVEASITNYGRALRQTQCLCPGAFMDFPFAKSMNTGRYPSASRPKCSSMAPLVFLKVALGEDAQTEVNDR